MKKTLLLLVSLGLLGGLSACGNDKKEEEDIPDVPVDVNIHANTISGDPTQPFYLRVNESKKLKVSLDPTPTLDSEKTFTWVSSNNDIAVVVMGEKETEATVTGKAPGNAIITATNKYNSNLVRTFELKVIQYDEDNNYLWEYTSEDRAQFGYSSDNKQGNKTGVARLSGLNWTFERDETNSLQSLNGGIGFGKGKEPENIHLETETNRAINGIIIETASANSLANMTVKVGDNEVINCAVPKSVDKHCSEISALNLEKLTGKVSIDFVTPKFDSSKEGDDTYLEPGVTVLKSIWFKYAEESFDFVNEKTYNFKEMYEDIESPLYKTNLKGNELVFEDEDFVIKFVKINKTNDTEALTGYAKTNSDIQVMLKKTNEVVKKVSFEYQSASSANQYNLYSSILGAAPYVGPVKYGDNSKVSGTLLAENINAINLKPNKTNYVGLKSLTIKTVAGEHASIESISFADGAIPTKVEYEEGDVFEPEGLGLATIKFSNASIADMTIGTDSFIFYDGPSYDEPSDHSEKKLELSLQTAYVVGVYQNYAVKIDGLTVNRTTKTLARVTSVEDLTTGEYLFVIPSSKQYWKGSMVNADMKTTASIGNLGEVEIDDSLIVPSSFLKETISIINESGIITISNKSGGKLGMTKTGGLSIAAKPEYSDWFATINNGLVDFVVTGGENTKHLGFTGTKFDLKDASTANIALYKVGE